MNNVQDNLTNVDGNKTRLTVRPVISNPKDHQKIRLDFV